MPRMAVIKEFREFIARGNVIDLAVGVIIGAAFGKIVTTLVEGVIMPPIGLVLGRIALEMNLRHERLITGSGCDEMKMCATPELGSAGWIWTIGNRANTLELVQTSFRRDHATAIAKVCSAV